ncbi:gtpase-activating protein [Plasmopara halstedii]|uniref:Gtpase-activating protein n=1 Tax=Plasmopara halstedii TaxID=4781 RepID=A0A0P1AFG6_PLAHL|nr:gtpase-activating protein [Plasmopara halstedii]CEG39566.1 gtpase-activating protein [Plasmopara halstedii]|eukprot:XP_024575935.1 gtpase-activating protein [Plasmopara halstedii]
MTWDHDSVCKDHETSAARVHGRQLVCFRPKCRFRLTKATLKAQEDDVEMACHCERQVLQCFVGLHQHTDNEMDMAEASYRQRIRKWNERFAARDWAQERVCQKWKENQKRFTKQQENVQKDDTISSKSLTTTAKMALSTFASAAEELLHSRQFNVLLKAGVSPQLRGQVWWMCSGAAELRREAKESYPALLHRLHTLSKCAEMDIEKDLPRTFPLALRESMRQSQEFSDEDSFGELRRVLQAYSLRNPTVGYCQSMNFLAAVLLQHMGEEEVFWVLAAIVEELTPLYHTRTMTGSRADQRVFSDLVTQKLPVLANHLQMLGVDFEPFTLKWFLCLFLNTLPFEPVMRIWDLFFCEGSHVLLRVGLVLLKLNQPRIMACDDALDVYEMFKVSHKTLQELTAPYRSGLLNRDECVCDTLVRLAMDKSFLGTIPFDTLHELRQFYRCEIEAEIQQAEARCLEHQCSTSAQPANSLNCSRTYHEDRALMLEYDFLDDYACSSGAEVSPSLKIRFMDLYDSDDSSADYFVDVMYDISLQHCR